MNNPAEAQLKCKKEAAMHGWLQVGICVSVGGLQGQVAASGGAGGWERGRINNTSSQNI